VLFIRTSQAVEATPAGKVLAEQARQVLSSFEFAITETRRAGSLDGPLRIGCVSFLPTPRLQQFLAELKKRGASVPLEVTHMWGLEQISRLRAGRLDLGIFFRADDYPQLECEPLFPGANVKAFLPSEHPLAAKSTLTPEDLVSETRITFPRSLNPAFHDRVMSRFEELGYRFHSVHEINGNDPRDALLAVTAGLGLVLGPSFLSELGDAGRDVVGRPLDPPVRLPGTVVAWRANPPRHLQPLLATVRESARALHAAIPED